MDMDMLQIVHADSERLSVHEASASASVSVSVLVSVLVLVLVSMSNNSGGECAWEC